jgi:hypothetical protein
MQGIPIGITASFSTVRPNNATAKFDMPAGPVVITFNPSDWANPGVLSLYDTSDVVLMTMTQGGNYAWSVPAPQATYYFKSTAAISTVAMTQPTVWR